MDETLSTSTIESNKRPFVERPVRYSIELEAGEFLLLLLEEELECVADFEFFEDGAEAVLCLVSRLNGFLGRRKFLGGGDCRGDGNSGEMEIATHP